MNVLRSICIASLFCSFKRCLEGQSMTSQYHMPIAWHWCTRKLGVYSKALLFSRCLGKQWLQTLGCSQDLPETEPAGRCAEKLPCQTCIARENFSSQGFQESSQPGSTADSKPVNFGKTQIKMSFRLSAGRLQFEKKTRASVRV